jgi:predicted membrane protein (TIGR00267 family)
MKNRSWLRDPSHRFHLVAGLCDGILTALTLGSGRLFEAGAPMSFNLAWRVAVAGGVSGMFMFFVAQYAELRRQLVEAERQLNITTHGRLATTQLGRAVLQEAVLGGCIAGVCSFLGTLYPLSLGALFPQSAWVAIAAALVALAALGVCLARSVHGNVIGWPLTLVVGGACLTLVGQQLKIV